MREDRLCEEGSVDVGMECFGILLMIESASEERPFTSTVEEISAYYSRGPGFKFRFAH